LGLLLAPRPGPRPSEAPTGRSLLVPKRVALAFGELVPRRWGSHRGVFAVETDDEASTVGGRSVVVRMSVDATAGVEELGGVGAWGPVVQHAAMVSRSLLTTTRSAAGSTCPANPWRERARGRWQGKLRSQPSRTQQEQAAAGRARAERAVKRLSAWRLPAWRLGLFTRDRLSAPCERRPDRQPSFDRRGRRQPTLPPIPSATAGAELPLARARRVRAGPGERCEGGKRRSRSAGPLGESWSSVASSVGGSSCERATEQGTRRYRRPSVLMSERERSLA
jgi:hypothetical protein